MKPIIMTQSTVKKSKNITLNVEPILGKVLQDAQEEEQKLQEVFEMMGWSHLPAELKIEIKDDVRAMVDEYEGKYSTCDPFVLKRRQRVVYWVENYQEKMCSLKTAIEGVKIRSL